ncbi:MAG TPA: DUF2784 domain-containing protein [Thermoanaerobaculia bacterium]
MIAPGETDRYRTWADAVLVMHFAFVLFALFGGLLLLVSRTWAWIHLPAVLWSSVVNLASWTCPLTPLEQACRRRAGRSYQGGFIEHYIGALVYPQEMPRRLEWIAGISVLLWNALVYAALLRFTAAGF